MREVQLTIVFLVPKTALSKNILVPLLHCVQINTKQNVDEIHKNSSKLVEDQFHRKTGLLPYILSSLKMFVSPAS